MQAELTESPLLTPDEVAALLRVDARTVLRYGAEGRLRVVRLTPRTYRYAKASVDALIEGDQTMTSSPVP